VLLRSAVIAVLAAGMLLASLPVAGASAPAAVPPTVAERLGGLPEAPAGLRGYAADAPRDSLPVSAPIPFSMIGLEVPDGASAVAFRTSVDGRTWTDWVEAELEEAGHGPEPGSAEAAGAIASGFTDLVWVGAARHVQTRVVGASPAAAPVHLIDAAGLGRSLPRRFADAFAAAWRDAPRTAAADTEAPAIVRRADWGADESLRSGTPTIARAARAIVVHHTAGSNDYSRADAAAVVRGIYRYHTRSLGWADIGYNVVVDRYGTVYEGRAGGLDRPVVGAHAGGYNTGTVGVALIGQHDTATTSPAGAAPTAEAMAALADVLAWKADLHHIDPAATVTIGGSAGFAAKTVPTILGHRDVTATSCPGNTVYRELAGLRDDVAERVGDLFVQPRIDPTSITLPSRPLADSTGAEVAFGADLAPAGPWQLVITDEAGTVVHRDSGEGASLASSFRPPQRAAVYDYALSGGDRRAVLGQITVLREVAERVGTAASTAAASVELARAAFDEDGSAAHAVLARADVFADAMAGGPLAGMDGPLLLTPTGGLDGGVRAELERVLPAGSTIYLLGGEAALGADIEEALAARWEVQRLSGAGRHETAAAIADVVRDRSGSRTVMVARAGPDDGSPWADALAGGAYGARTGIPVLLTDTDRLSPATRDALVGVEKAIVLGGAAAVSDAVARELPGMVRVSGPERTATAVAIA
jgi:hypothetical protein